MDVTGLKTLRLEDLRRVVSIDPLAIDDIVACPPTGTLSVFVRMSSAPVLDLWADVGFFKDFDEQAPDGDERPFKRRRMDLV
jgi:hypothetical protein